MAETALAKRRRSALQAISEHLQGRGASALTAEQVRSWDKAGRDGWTLSDGAGDVTIILDDDWPFVPPEFYISKDHPNFGGAHIGSDGKLCLAPSHSVYSQGNPVELLDALLEDARQLLARQDVSAQELVDEFQSYWLRDMQPKRTCLSLLKPQGPSRMVACWHGEKQSIYGENDEDVLQFLRRRHQLKSDPKLVTEPLLWLSRGLIPQEFPRRARHLWELARQLAPDGLTLLPAAAAHPLARVVFGFDTGNGAAWAALTLRRPAKFTKGFREHRMCQAVAVSRFFGSEKTEACRVERVDHAWIHSRGGEARHIGLQGKTVAILGCGSLGSGVAMLLSKSGVGSLVLVDGEALSWDNIGRHILGAAAVGQNKAEAVAAEIQRQLPSVSARGIAKTWQEAQRCGALDFNGLDLIISTSGDWPADSMLNFACRTGLEFPPVIITWFEAHALAGHALLVADMGGCFACGTDEFGNFSHRLTEWPQNSVFQREPACGGYFQPYGPGQMASTQGLAVTLAVDVLCSAGMPSELRSWVSSKARIESEGGQWTERVSASGISTEGGFLTEKWLTSQTCPLC